MSAFLKVRNSLVASDQTLEAIISILSDPFVDDMAWWGYYCTLPGIYHEVDIFLDETLDSLNYFENLELLAFIFTIILYILIYLGLFNHLYYLITNERNFRTSLLLSLPLHFLIHSQKLQNIK